MSDTIAELLNRLCEGRSSLPETRAQLAALVAANGDDATNVATRVRTELAAGRLRKDDARVLLESLQTVADPELQARKQNAFAPTLERSPQQPDAPVREDARTEVIASRRVQNLLEVTPEPSSLGPGSVIKRRFVLETLLGKGGMGLVFGAHDRRKEEARDPNPKVALKVLNSDFRRHPQSFIALQREARKAQTLAHPNVVTVFDFDRDGEVVYMTMELLSGRSLEAIAREARGKGIGADKALPIIRGIAEGLAYAHRKGIVHSDLKPGNVFITDDGTPKILDFGIARAVPSSAADDARDVFDAGVLGAYTEAYATDEMVGGIDPHPADDIYALGIIAYELLTGRHPYQRHSAPNARKLGIQPEPLKGLKRKEARAIAACLSLDRRDRPQDATAFLKQFRGVSNVQKASVAATVVLALVAGYTSYQSYVEKGPAIPFAKLPVERQEAFREKMAEAHRAWSFYEREGLDDAWNMAVDLYAQAYSLHPRNREAVAGLNRAADALLKSAATAEERRELALQLQQRSEHFRTYPPVVDAAR